MGTRLERRVVAKTASYTIKAQNDAPGTIFTNRGAAGAVTFTLPAPSSANKGHHYRFRVHADQDLIVAAAAAGQIVVQGDTAADNVGFQVTSYKVGGLIEVESDGSSWHAIGHRPAGGFCKDGSEMAPVSTILDIVGGLGALSASAAELNLLDGLTPGTVTASKAVVVDASKNAAAFGDLGARNIDAGSSGVSGTIDIFPSTAAKGKLAVSVTDQVGNTTVGLVIGAMAAARTVTLPDPLADADILTGKMAAVARTASADGLTTGTIAAAGLVQFVQVTSANADHIIVLPTPTPGTIVILNNGATGYELRSSDPATIAINGGTGAGAESAIAANSTVFAICISATAWKATFWDADSDVAKVEVAA